MNRSEAPAKQSKPFAINGQREPLLPTTPSGDNTASYEQGFPPITMILKSAGGLPPKGQDMNQILYELSALARWSSAGALNAYDSSFATAIGGYPKGAVLISDDGNTIYVNKTDSNSTNPNSSGAGWVDLYTYLGLTFIGFNPANGEAALFNGNKNLRLFVNNSNISGCGSSDFGLIWGFDDQGIMTAGIVPVQRLSGLSSGTGQSTTAVMSQKAVTDAIPTVSQTTGTSTTSVMSQKATTDAINTAKTTVVQSVGTSTTSVMSQNAVTSLVNDAASVGVNQLWNDVTSSRTAGVNYTNTTGRPIVIAMNVKNVPASLFASSITVQGIEISTGSTVAGEHRFISAIVPPGQVYMYQPLASSNFVFLELRT
ncbi:hypothetical protein ACNPG5_06160 [Citrobacter cronae]|uniref:hypothetical protein n=1 Tax=Citrobacter cronae TaxID=1748967 RepID=UPI003AA9C07C